MSKLHNPLSQSRSLALLISFFLVCLFASFIAKPAQAASDTFNCPGARGGLVSAPIQGIKWHDANGNKQQDSDESGLSGFTIEVVGDVAAGAQFITRTVTNDKGEFCIGGSDLPDGTYEVHEVLTQQQAAEWEQTFPAGGVHTIVVGPNTPFIAFGNKKKADLVIDKVRITNPVYYGQQISYTLTVSNVGLGLATGPITVTDVLTNTPLLTLPVSAFAPVPWSCTVVGGSVRCVHPGPLPANSSLPQITVTATVVANPPQPPLPLRNCAAVRPLADLNPQNNEDCDTTDLLQFPPKPPDITVSKVASPTLFTVGQPGYWVLNISNIGSGATTGTIYVTDTVPSLFTILGATGSGWSCTISGQLLTCNHPGPLATGANLPPIKLHIVPGSGVSQIENCADVNTVGDDIADNNHDCAQVEIKPGQVQPPDITLRKQISGSVSSPGTAIFSVTVSNIGTGATTGSINMTDTLPAYMTPISANAPAPWSCSISGQVVGCVHPGILAAGGSLPAIVITASVAGGVSQLANCAIVNTPGDAKPSNNQGCVETILNPGKPDLAIHKAISESLISGDTGIFSITVKNLGTGVASGPITVTDMLPTGLTPGTVSAPAPWNCTTLLQSVTCIHLGPLTAGDSLPTIEIGVSVTLQTGQNVVNCAGVTTVGDSNPLNNRDCVNIATDSDQDLIADTIECPDGIALCPDRDRDGLPNYLDDDDDGDGIPTANEVNPDGSPIDSNGNGVPDWLDNCTLQDAGGNKCQEDVSVWKITPRNGSSVQQEQDGSIRIGGCISCGVSIRNIAIDESGVHRTLGIAIDLDLPGVGDDSSDAGYLILIEADLDGDGEFEPLGFIQLLGDGSVRSSLGESQTLLLEVWKNGEKVSEVELSAGDLGKLLGGGSALRFNGLPPGNPSGMALHFGDDFSFTPNAATVSAAAPLTGDELRISAVNPTVTADGIDQVTITSETSEIFTIQGVGELGTRLYLPVVAR